jgi:hypothetical protein
MKARDRCTEDGSLRQTPGEKKVKKKMHDLHFFWVVGRGVKVILRFFKSPKNKKKKKNFSIFFS